MRVDNIPLAVGVIVFTVFALSLGDAIIKLSSNNLVLWQIFVLRSAMAIPILVTYMFITQRETLKIPTALTWTITRSLMLVLMWIIYYLSLPHIELSTAAAAYYTLPIFITLFSTMLTGDKVGKAGWLAVVLGFAGVLLILKPSANAFNWYTTFPLLSAVLYALAMILTRTKCSSEPPLLLALVLNISFVVVGLAATAITSSTWVSMQSAEWSIMAVLAVAVLIGSVGTAIAYQKAPASIVGVFDFAYVGFAVLWGIAFFKEYPDTIAALGITLIVASGIVSLRAARTVA